MKKIVVVLNSNTNRQSAKKNIRFEHELLVEIEEVKPADMSFSEWVKNACREKVANTNNATTLCVHSLGEESIGVRTNVDSSVRTETQKLEETAAYLAIQWHSQGMFHQQIADRLNQMEKYTPDGKPWTRLLVRQIVKQRE
ncbi:YlcI/YnfO family protein [Vibrio hannami]|uniref:YlcI/YnfO family protein n=1 Tax=Vibrio hannami TaxID=2717094 RepID=UPI0024101EBD|nr:YlcI/YnfO family protein [Vibrio hannami]MDG3085383.1 YlcI/YnfO family protein [Vibrio hannami]